MATKAGIWSRAGGGRPEGKYIAAGSAGDDSGQHGGGLTAERPVCGLYFHLQLAHLRTESLTHSPILINTYLCAINTWRSECKQKLCRGGGLDITALMET